MMDANTPIDYSIGAFFIMLHSTNYIEKICEYDV